MGLTVRCCDGRKRRLRTATAEEARLRTPRRWCGFLGKFHRRSSSSEAGSRGASVTPGVGERLRVPDAVDDEVVVVLHDSERARAGGKRSGLLSNT